MHMIISSQLVPFYQFFFFFTSHVGSLLGSNRRLTGWVKLSYKTPDLKDNLKLSKMVLSVMPRGNPRPFTNKDLSVKPMLLILGHWHMKVGFVRSCVRFFFPDLLGLFVWMVELVISSCYHKNTLGGNVCVCLYMKYFENIEITLLTIIWNIVPIILWYFKKFVKIKEYLWEGCFNVKIKMKDWENL